MKKQALLVLASAALLAGCSNENNEGMTDPDGRVALEVSSGIDVRTRAHDDQWDKGDAIGIYMLNGTTPESVNCKYTTAADAKEGSFSAADGQTIYFPIDGAKRDFIAYYPWQNIPAGSTAYSVDVTTQTTQKAIDLMGAAKVTGKDKNQPAVAFLFTHKLVKLYMTLKPDGSSLNANDLEGMTVTLTNQRTKATYDVLTNGSVTVDTSGELAVITLNTAADGTTAEGIVLPTGDTSGMLLTFALNGGETFTWAVHDAELSKLFAAGSKYIYTITIGKTDLKVTSTVTDWTSGNGDGESGSAQ
ncbi:fimbrillin family protein [Phocaeicola sp.]